MLSVALLRPFVAFTLVASPPVAREYSGVDALQAVTLETSLGVEAEPSTPGVEAEPVVLAAAEPFTEVVEGPLEDELELVPYDPLVDSPEAIRARHWIRSGIIFMVLGGALSVGAIAMSRTVVNDPELGEMRCDPRSDPGGNGCTPDGRRRSTLALAIPGVGLLAGGVAMMVVGRRQQRRLSADLQAGRRGLFIGAVLRF